MKKVAETELKIVLEQLLKDLKNKKIKSYNYNTNFDSEIEEEESPTIGFLTKEEVEKKSNFSRELVIVYKEE